MTSKTSPTLTHIDFRYSRMDKCGLTVKLNGRAEAPDWRRGRTISSSARGAQPPAHHGPFQRWLEDALNKPTVRARFPQRKPRPQVQRNFSLNRSRICDKRS